MNKAKLYSKSNEIQRRDAAYVLDKFLKYIAWREDGEDAILDIGCGAGDVTAEILLTKVPNTVRHIVGTDISEEMIVHANLVHEHEKLNFKQLDISTKNLREEFIEKFDHIMSFYCLHWVQDQKQAFENMYNMLKTNGDILLTFLASNPIYQIYENLSKKNRWKAYMHDVKNYVSPYQKYKFPEKYANELLEKSGFRGKVIKCEERKFIFENRTSWYESVKAVNPFVDRIPTKLRQEYFEDFFTEVKNLSLVEDNNNEEKIFVPYNLITIYAKK